MNGIRFVLGALILMGADCVAHADAALDVKTKVGRGARINPYGRFLMNHGGVDKIDILRRALPDAEDKNSSGTAENGGETAENCCETTDRPGTKNADKRGANYEFVIYYPLVIKLADESAELPDYVVELHRRGRLVLVTVPQNRISELTETEGVEFIEASVASTPTMNLAMNYCNVGAVAHSETNINGLTGRGVVTGFSDVGFYPHHINFKDSDGNSRVKQFVIFEEWLNKPTVLTGEDEISEYRTDNSSENHATHVCGIMSGSYDTPFGHGIATESDIVATTSMLYTATLLDGCEYVIDYAKSHGKPAVINMSVSEMTGPHDGTTLTNQYINSLSDDATLCISAGNDGQRPGFIDYTVSEEMPRLHVYTREWPTWSTSAANGSIDIWADDSTPFTLNIVGWSLDDKAVTYRWDSEDFVNGGELVVCSSEYATQFPNHAEPLLPSRYFGYIYVTGEVNPENGRFNGTYVCKITNKNTSDEGKIVFGPEIVGETGAHIEVYGSSKIYLDKFQDSEGLSATSFRALNDMTSGGGALCIGSMDSRTACTMIDGSELSWSRLSEGGVSYFSSYGTLNNGEIFPTVCAPGAQVVSSLSTPYYTSYSSLINDDVSYKVEDGDNTYYWGPMQGTSMSSPFAAGIVALWLEACPDLTGHEMREIAIQSAAKPTINPSDPKWGNGIIDAAAGLQMALNRSSVISPTVKSDVPRLYTFNQGSSCRLVCTAPLTHVTVYDQTGRVLRTVICSGTEATLTDLPHGLLILSAHTTTNATIAQKIIR